MDQLEHLAGLQRQPHIECITIFQMDHEGMNLLIPERDVTEAQQRPLPTTTESINPEQPPTCNLASSSKDTIRADQEPQWIYDMDCQLKSQILLSWYCSRERAI